MLNDARVASLGFFKDNICTTRINKEKKFKIKFQVLLKFAQILLDYKGSYLPHIRKTEYRFIFTYLALDTLRKIFHYFFNIALTK